MDLYNGVASFTSCLLVLLDDLFCKLKGCLIHSPWCCFKCHAVVSVSYALDSYCYKLLYCRVSKISSNHNIWHLYELDLLEILS